MVQLSEKDIAKIVKATVNEITENHVHKNEICRFGNLDVDLVKHAIEFYQAINKGVSRAGWVAFTAVILAILSGLFFLVKSGLQQQINHIVDYGP